VSGRDLDLIRELAERTVEAIQESDGDYAIECAVLIIEAASLVETAEAAS
jgi:hypothetical protein